MWQKFKNSIHFWQAVTANIWYGFPSRGVKIIGVTGTDGKTTTASLIYHILEQTGQKAALISSVSAIIDGKDIDIGFHVTTPRFFALRSYIKKAKLLGANYIVIEVTSHALDQHRVSGIHFDIGVLTNITNEHLDYHKSYEQYLSAKVKLLKKAKIAIINKDDGSYPLVYSRLSELKNKIVVSYGFTKNADVNMLNFPFQTKLFGKYNQYNCLAAIAVAKSLSLNDEEVKKAIATFELPRGRFDVVYKNKFSLVIDFAHTPNAFEQLLNSIRPTVKGKIIHVFGSAGERDKYKRPQMGKISSKYADVIILTSEDPRSESFEEISAQIRAGILNRKPIYEIEDRKQAIEEAIKLADKGDLVLLTGKGHEKSMNMGKGEEAWDEFEVVKTALAKRGL